MHDALSVKIVSFPKLGEEEEEEVHQTSVFYREIQMSAEADDFFKSATLPNSVAKS